VDIEYDIHMRARIRGHYRIDENGKVIPIREPSGAGLAYETPPLPPIQRRRLPPLQMPTRLEIVVIVGLLTLLKSLLFLGIRHMQESARSQRQMQTSVGNSPHRGAPQSSSPTSISAP
jgi:hypothetical protein